MQKKPVHRAIYLEDAPAYLDRNRKDLCRLRELRSLSDFTTAEKAQYRDVLSRLLDLIHDLEQNSAQEQLAS